MGCGRSRGTRGSSRAPGRDDPRGGWDLVGRRYGVVYFSASHRACPVKFPVTSFSGTVVTTSDMVLRIANRLRPVALLNFPVPPVTMKSPPHPSPGFPVQVQPA